MFGRRSIQILFGKTFGLISFARVQRSIRKKDAGPENIRSFLYKNHEYAGKRVKSATDISNPIFERIDCGKPFMAGRFGAAELSALKTFDFEIKSTYRQSLEQMRLWSVFP